MYLFTILADAPLIS